MNDMVFSFKKRCQMASRSVKMEQNELQKPGKWSIKGPKSIEIERNRGLKMGRRLT